MRDRSGLEVHVCAAEGFHLPDDCFVAVKLGDVLKQGRYRPDRAYRFPAEVGPAANKLHVGKIDLFKQIGSCRIEASSGEHEVWVESTDPENHGQVMDLKLKVAVSKEGQGKNSPNHMKASAGKDKAEMVRSANDYLKESNVEEMLSDAVKALLRSKPPNARQFVINYLAQNGDVNFSQSAPAPQVPPNPPQPAQTSSSLQPQHGADFQLRPTQAQQRINPQLAPIEKDKNTAARPQALQSNGFDILGSSLNTPKDGAKSTPKAAPPSPSKRCPPQPPDPKEAMSAQEQKACKPSERPDVLEKKEQKEQKEQPKPKAKKAPKEEKKLKDEAKPEEEVLQEEKNLVKEIAYARDLVTTGMQNGLLHQALENACGEAVVNKEPPQKSPPTEDMPPLGLNVLRHQLQDLLEDAMEEGKLEEIVGSVLYRSFDTDVAIAAATKVPSNDQDLIKATPSQDLKAVHSKARASLAAAAHSGKLSTTLSSLSFIASLDASRQKVRKSLQATAQSGKLSAALHAASLQ